MVNVDYAATYFKYPVPCPINGEPTNKTLKRLKMELRANGSSVDTDLGGGRSWLPRPHFIRSQIRKDCSNSGGLSSASMARYAYNRRKRYAYRGCSRKRTAQRNDPRISRVQKCRKSSITTHPKCFGREIYRAHGGRRYGAYRA